MLLALTKDTSIIRLESRHLNVSFDGEEKTETVPLPLIERVVLTDVPRISGAVIQELLLRHIPVTFISAKGEFAGQIHYTPGGDAERKLRQIQFSEKKFISPACRVLEAKLYNQKRLLQRWSASHQTALPECQEISKLYKSLKYQTTLETLKGIEGLAARCYFKALQKCVPAWCGFCGRNRRPPADPVNALLSYSYAVMTGEMENLIRLHGLDPGIGFLHCSQYNTSTLALDLLEPFRPGYCDMLALDLLNHRRLKEEHFQFMPDESCRLTQTGRKIFFAAWENKRQRNFKYNGKTTNWQEIWNNQVMQYLNYLNNSDLPSFFRMP